METKPAHSALSAGVLSKLNVHTRQEIIDSIKMEASRLVVVTGTGVTLQSIGHPVAGTEVASWQGLLSNGLNRCRKLELIDEPVAKIVEMQIQSKACQQLMQAAQTIHGCLDKRVNERMYWMKETIGSLKVTDPRLINAILALNGLVTTLNYDDTVFQVSGRPPLHWKQTKELTKCITDHPKSYTLHLHGHWSDLRSIVLDSASYEEIRKDEYMRGLLQEFARFSKMLFIGCRHTFLDPNFKTLLDWAHDHLRGLESRHFILCLASEERDILQELQPHGYLTPLVYGEQHSDLVPYLEKLAIDARGAAATVNPPIIAQAPVAATLPPNVRRPADIWKLHSLR